MAHYLWNSFVGVRSLMISGQLSLVIQSIIAVIPFVLLVILALILIKQKGFIENDQILNNDHDQVIAIEGPAKEEIANNFILQYSPLRILSRIALVALIILASTMFLIKDPRPKIADWHIYCSRNEAVIKAKEFMSSKNIATNEMLEGAVLSENSAYSGDLQYLFEQIGPNKMSSLVSHAITPPYRWRIRFCKPLDPQEYQVCLDNTGKVINLDIRKAEDAKGASLTLEEAKEIASKFLKENRPQYNGFIYDTFSKEKRKNRTDYWIKFKVPDFKVGKADFKVSVLVMGNEVAQISRDWCIPDDWQFERYKKSIKDDILSGTGMVLSTIIGIAILIWLIGAVRKIIIPWRPLIYVSAALASLNLLSEMNDIPKIWAWYDTTEPVNVFITTKIIDLFGSLASSFGMFVITLTLGYISFKTIFPRLSILSTVKTIFIADHSQKIPQRNIWLDAILASTTFFLVGEIIDKLFIFLRNSFSTEVQIASTPSYVTDIASSLCSWLNMGSYIQSMFTNFVLAACVAVFYVRYIKTPKAAMVLLLALITFSSLSCRELPDTIIYCLNGYLACIALAYFMVRIAKNNILTYVLIIYFSSLIGRVTDLFQHGLPLLLWDAYAMTAILLLPFFYLAYLWLPIKSKSS